MPRLHLSAHMPGGQHPHKGMRPPHPPCTSLGAWNWYKGAPGYGLGQGLSVSHGQALGQEQVSVEAEQAPGFLPVFPSTLLHVPGTTGQQATHLASFPQSLSLWKLICSGRTLGLQGHCGRCSLSPWQTEPLMFYLLGTCRLKGETPVAASSHLRGKC